MNEELTAIWSGTFRVFGVELKCHVLSDGQRIIEAESMKQFLCALGDSGVDLDGYSDLTAFAEWYRGGWGKTA